jgi:hypothetical protein
VGGPHTVIHALTVGLVVPNTDEPEATMLWPAVVGALLPAQPTANSLRQSPMGRPPN